MDKLTVNCDMPGHDTQPTCATQQPIGTAFFGQQTNNFLCCERDIQNFGRFKNQRYAKKSNGF